MATDLAELRAEVSVLRALVLTMAPMVFCQEGISAENVEALGAAFADQIQGIKIEGADPKILQRMRDLKAGAIADLFSDAADRPTCCSWKIPRQGPPGMSRRTIFTFSQIVPQDD